MLEICLFNTERHGHLYALEYYGTDSWISMDMNTTITKTGRGNNLSRLGQFFMSLLRAITVFIHSCCSWRMRFWTDFYWSTPRLRSHWAEVLALDLSISILVRYFIVWTVPFFVYCNCSQLLLPDGQFSKDLEGLFERGTMFQVLRMPNVYL